MVCKFFEKRPDSLPLILSLILTLGTYQEQNRCLPCHGSCLSCSGPERINCLSCPAGTRLHDYICQSCALGTYYESLSNKCNKCHQGCSTCSGPLTSDCMSCMDPNLHLDENNTCVPCCNTLDSEESSENCCPCDEKNMKCLVEKDLEHNGSKKRRSNGAHGLQKGDKKGDTNHVLVHNTIINGFVIFFTVIILPVACIMAYKKYYKRFLRQIQTNLNGHSRNTRAKWRRHQTYEKVNSDELSNGCEDSSNIEFSHHGNNTNMDFINNQDSDGSESEETEDMTYIFGEERRRLLHTSSSNTTTPTSSNFSLPSDSVSSTATSVNI